MDHLPALLFNSIADLFPRISISRVKWPYLIRRRTIYRIHMDAPVIQDPCQSCIMIPVPVCDDGCELRDPLLCEILHSHVRQGPAATVDQKAAPACRDEDLRISPSDICTACFVAGYMYGKRPGCRGSIIGRRDPVRTEPCKHLCKDVLCKGCPCIAPISCDMCLYRIPAARPAIYRVISPSGSSHGHHAGQSPDGSFFRKRLYCCFQL